MPWEEPPEEDHWELVQEIDGYDALTDWESDFIGWLIDQRERHGEFPLTPKQKDKIEQIHEERDPYGKDSW